MLYHAYQSYADLFDPMRVLAGRLAPAMGLGDTRAAAQRHVAAAMDVFARLRLTHARPAWGIDTVTSEGRECTVDETPVLRTPFCTLLRFGKTPQATQPRVLLVAPMSGHFATLLRPTVRTMLADHEVYVTDWHNARDVPLGAGRFDLDDYTDTVVACLRHLGPGVHVVAVCQPCVPVLAAAAVMAQGADPAQPRTLTLMAGPIDTRIAPTEVNRLATSQPHGWFERHLIHSVPWPNPGAGRRVYPGFLQIAAFMSMNPDRHVRAFLDLYKAIADGDDVRADAIRTFYEEYFAMADLPAEFYLQTVRAVFQEHDLPRGRLTHRGRPVEPAAIARPSLLTVEGERDDICSVGQTLAAQELCTGVRAWRRRHHVQTGVGHYGVFAGRRWERHIYPLVRDFCFFGA